MANALRLFLMCGIAGFLDFRHTVGVDLGNATALRMARRIAHRGPDDQGGWSDVTAGIFLAHRRLSILDLSPAGHQPMISASGRYVIVFNGEIYNHECLRNQLQKSSAAPEWRGHSDTEVLLAAIEAHGVHAALDLLTGMFAIAVWDRKERTLVLARDRLGEKPLFWARIGDVIAFASEIKALRAYPGFEPEVDRDSLTLLLRYGYVSAPYSIHKAVRKIEPATYVSFGAGSIDPVTTPYWSAHAIIDAGRRDPWRGTADEAASELQRLLEQSIARQMVADVPIGAFLSGGIDSSLVVALAQKQSQVPVRTFSIGFEEESYNEAHYARAVANHLGTRHTELVVSSADALAVVPMLPQLYDEPLSDPSQIPTYLVSKLARGAVTVALSGDGGDELFAGYTRYIAADSVSRAASVVPELARSGLAWLLASLSPESWNSVMKPLLRVSPRKLRYSNIGDKLHKLASVMACPEGEIYRNMVSHWMESEKVVIGGREPRSPLSGWPACPDFVNQAERGSWLDLISYLPDDILAKVDRAAMAVSLETRIPLLDRDIVEFSWRLPVHMKLHDGVGKWLLREVAYRHVPRALLDRPKMGFGIPLDYWLRHSLRDWAESLIGESRLRTEGYFNPEPIRRLWSEHLSGKRNHQFRLWSVLMFQAWLDQERGYVKDHQ
jgi:asparagine synthase (glutamine-hydrolysing)